MSDTVCENRPPSPPPKEESVCPPPPDSASSGECDTHTDHAEAVPEKAEREREMENSPADDNLELDYEEDHTAATTPPHASNTSPSEENAPDDKKDESKPNKVKHIDEDEGEISGEEDDLEEGELKDVAEQTPTAQSSSQQICRFFRRGQCYYGQACRFVHTNIGKYNMFAPRYPDACYGTSPINMMMCDRVGPGRPPPGIDYMGITVPPPPMHLEQTPVESAWERGLREAKELVKKANKRKEEPDFDKKKNYLSITFNEKNTDFDKENDYLRLHKNSKRNPDYKKSSRDGVCGDPFYEETQRSRRYENFEIHYSDDMERMSLDRRERSRGRSPSERERERYASKERNRNRERDRNKVKDDRALFHVQMRTRAFEYVDPWRRSKTPKARGGRSRSGSYSSLSSSCSDRSSRSVSASPAGSYSRSSSKSSISCASSRSPSVQKRKSPAPEAGFSKAGSNRFPVIRKKGGSPSSFSSRSRSVSTVRSRSYSRSPISMDSVSSNSSCASLSSCESLKKTGNSLLRKKSPERDKKLPLEMLDDELARGEITDEPENVPEGGAAPGFTSYMQFLPDHAPGNEKAKPLHKQPIKLTLLNKPLSSTHTIPKSLFPQKEIDRSKLLPDPKNDTSKLGDNPSYTIGGKRPLSPASSPLNLKPDMVLPKKSASCRRDELLKQLKAVEDAIARKRAKFC